MVCPTTLIYNWENEITKFTPDLTYRIHHGPARTRAKEEIMDHEITITTYGTLRSDIKLLMSVEFDYVILDESQAIKNPSSKVTKAACLLNAKNRLCMSGTPLQNNTFDIFAQMNFLNPGMLGTMEFFRQEFSIPIDKFGEQDQKRSFTKNSFSIYIKKNQRAGGQRSSGKAGNDTLLRNGNASSEIFMMRIGMISETRYWAPLKRRVFKNRS